MEQRISWSEAKRCAETFERKAKNALNEHKSSFPDFAMYITNTSDYYPSCIQPWEMPKPHSAQAFLPIGRYEGHVVNICYEGGEEEGIKYDVIMAFGPEEYSLSKRVIKVDYSGSCPCLALDFAGLFASTHTKWVRVRVPGRCVFYFPYYN